jgi:hypothetical protein
VKKMQKAEVQKCRSAKRVQGFEGARVDSLKLRICTSDSLKAGRLESSKDQKLKSFIYSKNHKLRDYNAIIF